MLTDDQLKALKPVDVELTDTLATDDTTIDLSGYGAAQDTLTLGSDSIDYISIPNISYDYGAIGATVGGISTITLPSSSYSNSNYTINTGSSGQFYTATGSNGTTWTTGAGTSTVNISTDGIDMAAGTDIKIDGQSLKEFMKKMEQRLAILVPDPAKLEKFKALQKAYEHYKTMESLCFDEPEEPK